LGAADVPGGGGLGGVHVLEAGLVGGGAHEIFLRNIVGALGEEVRTANPTGSGTALLRGECAV
jgi:hypothetical protein